jgi:hypothetical protein
VCGREREREKEREREERERERLDLRRHGGGLRHGNVGEGECGLRRHAEERESLLRCVHVKERCVHVGERWDERPVDRLCLQRRVYRLCLPVPPQRLCLTIPLLRRVDHLSNLCLD